MKKKKIRSTTHFLKGGRKDARGRNNFSWKNSKVIT